MGRLRHPPLNEVGGMCKAGGKRAEWRGREREFVEGGQSY